MTYGQSAATNTKPTTITVVPGSAYLLLSPSEAAQFAQGQWITKHTADARGHARITVKITRPRSRKDRFVGL